MTELSDRSKKAVAYLSYAVIFGYGLLTTNLLIAIGVIVLLQILRELKKQRYQRALIFEEQREPAQTLDD